MFSAKVTLMFQDSMTGVTGGLQKKMNERKCLSEHPFGTVKRAVGMSYLLLKGKTKVIGETALMFLSYNLRRAISIKSVEDMVKALA